jgi:hypothetical protein
MFEERLIQLEQRLAETEKEVQSLRQQLGAAQGCRSWSISLGQALGGALLVALVGLWGLLAATNGIAQAPAKPQSVKAPFVVVDSGGKSIFRVAEEGNAVKGPLTVVDGSSKPIMEVGAKGLRRLHLYDSAGADVVSLGETKGGDGATVLVTRGNNAVGLQTESGDKMGGFFYMQNGKVTSRLGEVGLMVFGKEGKKATEVWAKGVAVYDQNEKRIVRFGADPKSEFGSLVLGKDGKALVGLVVEKDAGLVVLRDSSNQSIVELGEPGVQVFNKGKAVARLGTSPSGKGSGYLSLGNPGGDTIVEGGMLPEGDGVVRAYPLSGRTPIPIPNFIRGGKSDK